jgi:hypothetical protein
MPQAGARYPQLSSFTEVRRKEILGMSKRARRTRSVAAIGVAGVSLFPWCAAASAADVQVSIDNLHPQDPVMGPNVAIQADFKSTTAHSINRVELLVDGKVIDSHALDQPVPQGRFIFAWDTTALSNDVHVVTARAYDDQNQVGSTDLQLFVDNQAIDRAQPLLRITTPAEGAVVTGKFEVRAEGTERSASEPIPYVIVKLDNDIIGWFGGKSSAHFLYDDSALKDGPHTLQAFTQMADQSTVSSPPIIVIVSKGGGLTNDNAGPNPPPTRPSGDGPGSQSTASTLPAVAPAPTLPPVQIHSDQGTRGASGFNPNSAAGAGLPGGGDPARPTAPVVPPVIGPTPPQVAPIVSQPVRISTLPNARPTAPSTFVVPPAATVVTTPSPARRPMQMALLPNTDAPLVEDAPGWTTPGSLKGQELIAPRVLSSNAWQLTVGPSSYAPELVTVAPATAGRADFRPMAQRPTSRMSAIIAPRLHPIQVAMNSTLPEESVFAGLSSGQLAAGVGAMSPPASLPVLSGWSVPMTGRMGTQTSSSSPSFSMSGALPMAPASGKGSPILSMGQFVAMAPAPGTAGSLADESQPTFIPGAISVQPGALTNLAGGRPMVMPTVERLQPSAASPSPMPSSGVVPSLAGGTSIEPGAPVLPDGTQPIPSSINISPTAPMPGIPLSPASGSATGSIADPNGVSIMPITSTRIVLVQTNEPLHQPSTPPVQMALRSPGLRAQPAGQGSSQSDNDAVFIPVPLVMSPKPSGHARPAMREALLPAPRDSASQRYAAERAHSKHAPEWMRVAYDNHWMNLDVPPMMVKQVPVAPFRALFEYSGGKVQWHSSNQSVTASGNGKLVLIRIGSHNALINHQVVRMAMPAFIKRGRTMVPLGFIGQAMDVNIQFDEVTGEITITDKHVVALNSK